MSNLLNARFTSLKVYADKVETDFAESMSIYSYPTLLFLGHEGTEIHRQVGPISKHALFEKAQEVLHYWNNQDVLSRTENYNVELHSLDEIRNILEVASGFPFPNKVALAKRYLYKSSPTTDETLELTMDQLSQFSDDTYNLIAPMVGQFLPFLVLHDRIGVSRSSGVVR